MLQEDSQEEYNMDDSVYQGLISIEKHLPLIRLRHTFPLHITSAILLYVLLIIEKNAENKRRHFEEMNKQEKDNLDSNKNMVKSLTNCSVCSESQQSWQVYISSFI
jgi:hypothetical protein